LKIPLIAPSLGGVESLIDPPALMSFWNLPKEEREKLGIPDNLIRLALGIEDTNDLIDDLRQALAGI
jgi:cystathionine gamma-synthase